MKVDEDAEEEERMNVREHQLKREEKGKGDGKVCFVRGNKCFAMERGVSEGTDQEEGYESRERMES